MIKNVLSTYIKVKLTETTAEFQNYTFMELNIGGVNSRGFELANFEVKNAIQNMNSQ